MNKTTKLIITILFGWFGIHKFIEKDYKMGIIYMFTVGLFGIGWFIDIFKVLFSSDSSSSINKSYMSREDINKINNGELPNIAVYGLNLQNGEYCCYADYAQTFKDKIITTGYTKKGAGVSIRVMKGLSYHTGGGGTQAIRETQRTTYNGLLYITNQRVIYTSQNNSFDKPFNKITSIMEAKDGLLIQIGSETYSIITKSHSLFMKVFNMVK